MMKVVILVVVFISCVLAGCKRDSFSNCDPATASGDWIASNMYGQVVPIPNVQIESISLNVLDGAGDMVLHLHTNDQDKDSNTVTFNGAGVYQFTFSNLVITDADGGSVEFYIPFQYGTFQLAASATDVCIGDAEGMEKRGVVIPNPADIYYEITFSCAGSSGGDPHFYGFQGQKYDVMGESFEIYNLISAPYLQINSRFTPYYKTATQLTPTGTMIGEVGLKFHGQTFHINPNSSVALLSGQSVSMTSDWTVSFGDIKLSNSVTGRMYALTIDSPDVSITFMRKTYMIAGLEEQFHFDYKAKAMSTIQDVHGLLGQTWELKEFTEKQGAFKFLDGYEEDYRIQSNDIFGDDFTFNRFQNL